jgi:hypothetical protein
MDPTMITSFDGVIAMSFTDMLESLFVKVFKKYCWEQDEVCADTCIRLIFTTTIIDSNTTFRRMHNLPSMNTKSDKVNIADYDFESF